MNNSQLPLEGSRMEFNPPCTGKSDIFFPTNGHPGVYDEAQAICMGCPRIGPCGDQALVFEEPAGVWGGMTPADRATILGSGRLRGRTWVHGPQAARFLAEVG